MKHFFGYGSWEARYWFISHEEGGGDFPEEVADKVNWFKANHPDAGTTLCDIRSLYKNVTYHGEGTKADLYNNVFDYRFGADATPNTIWRNLTDFESGFESSPKKDQLAYQQSEFVSPEAKREALIRLYPLPCPHNHAWYYSWLGLPGFEFLRTRAQYEEALYEQRVSTILNQLHQHTPEVVLMYGMKNINRLKQSFSEYFEGVKFKQAKAIALKLPQHHYTDVKGTRVVITTQIPALRHNRIETGFDWVYFGETVREYDF